MNNKMKLKEKLAYGLIYGIGTYICTTANTYFYAYVLGNLALASVASLLSMVVILPAVISVVAALIMKFMYPIGKAELEAQTTTLKGVSR